MILIHNIELVVHKVDNLRDEKAIAHAIQAAVGSHLYGFQDMLSPKIADACIQVCPKNPVNFSVDNVRVAKILGMGITDTEVVKGFVLTRGAEGNFLL